MRCFQTLFFLLLTFLFFSACTSQNMNRSASGDDRMLSQKNGSGFTTLNQAAVRKTQSCIALVIGNNAYANAPLRNPVNDARAMKDTLEGLGFTVDISTDANKREMLAAISRFGKKLQRAEIGFFFYAGHGIGVGNRNYIIPVDASVEIEEDVQLEAIDVSRVLSRMKNAGTSLNVVVLDACRNNPFNRSFRSSSTGLVKMDAPVGTLIAYATSPGSVAADGKGRNGLYTSCLLQALKKPNVELKEVFNSAGLMVIKKTGSSQVPWLSSTPMPPFFFGISGQQVEETFSNPAPLPLRPATLTVRTSPQNARVRILHIKPKYRAGIALAAGTYTLEVSALDYQSQQRQVKLIRGKALVEDFILKPEVDSEPEPSAVFTPQSPGVSQSLTDPTTGMEFVLVKGGCYQMGDTFGRWWTQEGYKDEKPVHEVCVDDFYMGKYEVT